MDDVTSMRRQIGVNAVLLSHEAVKRAWPAIRRPAPGARDRAPRYAGIIHAPRKRTGHFRRGRFGADVMDEGHLAAAPRHVALNPVRARLV
jgi:hypothetical protein